MSTTCSYKNCYNQKVPGSCLSFFVVPKDWRKLIWMKHCEHPTPTIKSFLLCEKHFYDSDIKTGGMKKNLTKTALPIQIDGVCMCTEDSLDENCMKLKEKYLNDLKDQAKLISKNLYDEDLYTSKGKIIIYYYYY